jgi:hypothetical protein
MVPGAGNGNLNNLRPTNREVSSMCRVLILVVALLGSAAWAQDSHPGQDQTAQTASDSSKEVTASGCLQQSGAYLYLTQNDGTQIQVIGPKLDEYKGHEVEVSGERSSKAIDTTVSGAASSATLRPLIKVKSVRDLGSTCSKTFD